MSEPEQATPTPTTPTPTPTTPEASAAPPEKALLPERVERMKQRKTGPRRDEGGMPNRRLREPIPALDADLAYGGGQKLRRDLDEEIAAELEAALGSVSAKDMFAGETSRQVRAKQASSDGGRKQGTVLSIHGSDVFIEVPGGRSQGVLALEHFPEGAPKPGSTVDVTIEGYDAANGLLILARKGEAVSVDWSSVAEGMIVEAKVTATNKGGLAVEVNNIRGFMPISQIDLGRVENPEQFVHQRLKCIVTDVDPADRNLIVSRRALLEKEREELREKLWGALAEGQVREGVVRNVREFGAFVDLGGVDGLLHVGEMSWKRVADPTTIVQPGQRLKVVILRIDQQTRKLSLGLKQLEANPWDAVTQNYHVGQVIKGKVVRTQDFGAFVELEPGIEGLIHVSEIARGKVWRVADHVKVGQEVESKILSIDPEARRIGLSLKQALPEPVVKPVEEEEEPEVAPTPVKVKKRVTPLRGGTGTGPLFSLPTPPPAPPATES